MIESDYGEKLGAYQMFITDMIGQIDREPGVYAEVFNRKLENLTPRNPSVQNTPFDPKVYDTFIPAVTANESGTIILPARKPFPYDLNIYYRWIPSEYMGKERFLVVTGVSELTANVKPIAGVLYGTMVLIIISTLIIIGSLVLLFQRLRCKCDE